MRKLIIGLALVFLLIIPAACASSSSTPSAITSKVKPGITSATTTVVPAPIMLGSAPNSASSGRSSYDQSLVSTPATEGGYAANGVSASTDRMIVRTADMQVIVKDVVKARDAVAALATKYGGFVVSSQISGEGDDMSGWVSIRITDDKLDQALSDIRGMAVRVKSENTSSQDITEQYVDLGARLSNAESTEKEYLALLNKAVAVEDIVKIYSYLTQVREQIEQLKAQMQYLERTSSLSLISVRLEPEISAKPLVQAGWQPLEILKAAVRGIVTFAQVLGSIAIWLLIFIPVWGTVLGIIWWRKRKTNRPA